MARIRTMKPEVHLDEELWDLEVETGLPIFRAFTGLWNHADREGRFEWRPRKLKAGILPYWDGDFSRVLHALTTRGFVGRYTCDGREYGVVRTFTRHQVINNREGQSEIPSPPDDLFDSEVLTRGARVDDATSTPLVHALAEGKGREGKGREGKGVCEGVVPTTPATTKLARRPRSKPTASSRVWDAYADAYRQRYGEDPTRNARVNGQLAQFVSRVPADEAPAIAAAYVGSNNRRYVGAGHNVGCLLQDAEKLRTEWLTGRQGTAHSAAQADRLSGRMDGYAGVFAQLRAEDEEGPDGEA